MRHIISRVVQYSQIRAVLCINPFLTLIKDFHRCQAKHRLSRGCPAVPDRHVDAPCEATPHDLPAKGHPPPCVVTPKSIFVQRSSSLRGAVRWRPRLARRPPRALFSTSEWPATAIYGTRRLASTCCAALHVPLVVCVRCVMMQSHRGRSMLASCCQRATCMIWCVRCRMAGPAAALDVPSV